MSPQLTERQNQIYEFVRAHLRDEGIPPTVDEIRQHLGLVSTNGVHKHLLALERKGVIVRTPGVSRGIKVLAKNAAARGRETGPPNLPIVPVMDASQRHRLRRAKEFLHVDLKLIPRMDPEDGLVGYVDDDGMADEGIYKNDYVVIEETGDRPIPAGTLVAVIVEDALLVRRLSFKGERVVFTPSARHYKERSFMAGSPVYLVIGPVRGVLRAL
ncbi:MAG TPA: LexA family transcriptional regulator [Bacteroidetes bacterium]|nr:LexA family transcriptional regulator [Bacteroidota bacterium]HIL58454.1 LexA family transcriptional regulator [Rhodothermales bacterium]